jgi:hypothetical protein
MAPENTTIKPSSVAAPAPDTSALASPGAASVSTPVSTSATPAVTQSGMPGVSTDNPIVPGAPATSPASYLAPSTPIDPHIQAANAAADQATKIAAESTAAPPPGPHAKLLAMVQGLAVGLGAASRSLATRGKEGGAEDVQNFYAKQQELQQSAQAARDASKNQRLQQALTAVSTNTALANMAHLAATWPGELTEQGLKIAAAKQGLSTNAADFAAAHGGMTADDFNAQLSGAAPVGGTTKVNPWFSNNANIQLAGAVKQLGANDPYVQAVYKVLQDPNASAKDLYVASTNLQNQIGTQAKATDEQIKKDSAFANSTVGKLATPTALADPGAQAAIQAAIDSPSTDPKDIPTLRGLIPQAALAQQNALNIKMREQRNQELVDNGTPEDAAKLLVNHSLTLPELKTRKVTAGFILEATKRAQEIDPTFKPSEADAQAKAAGSEANVQFFRNTDSLLVKNGTLDQLAAAYKNLGNTKLPAVNTLENLRKAAVGDSTIARAYAAQLGVIDDYAKVMAGSGGSDNAREAAFKILSLGLSPDAQSAAIDQIKQQVESQRNGQIGVNPYLKDMFPDPATRREVAGLAGTQPALKQTYTRPAGVSSGAKLMQAPGGQPHWIEPVNQKAAQNAGAVELPQ